MAQPVPARLPATKRRRDLDFSPESAPTRRCKSQCHDVIFRVVVPSRQIGKVIGKEGCRIQKIREASRASIKIADAVARNEERVIIISSKGSDDETTDAENALQQIAGLILKDGENGSEAAKVGAGHVAANAIRLLIAGSQAVLAPSQLPLCASAHESDRVVQISGDVPAVQKGLEEISCHIRENPPKQVISLSPAYNYTAIRPPQVQPYIDPTSAEYLTVEMMISETMVGGLIGRCGSNISRIRNETGAMIKVYGGKGEEKHRQIQFCGNSQQALYKFTSYMPYSTRFVKRGLQSP
ncbi:hypothetical protein ACLB2K_068966 [Fragaria x ananassa]